MAAMLYVRASNLWNDVVVGAVSRPRVFVELGVRRRVGRHTCEKRGGQLSEDADPQPVLFFARFVCCCCVVVAFFFFCAFPLCFVVFSVPRRRSTFPTC